MERVLRLMSAKKILIIGAGGVSRVVVHKCVQNITSFGEITLASRTISKCETIANEIKDIYNISINIHQLDANDTNQVVKLIEATKVQLVLNIALPYQDLSIMNACIKTKTHYLDTANYEHPNEAKFEYKEQWALHNQFKKSNILALLGSGFDPGVTNIFIAYANQYIFDEVHNIDIMDCNDGEHGYHFATNFNPEINIREITQKGKYWKNGNWIEVDPLSIKIEHNYPEIGTRESYLLYHEEMESLVKNIKTIKQIRFFMTFSKKYLKHLEVLENIGMTSIEPIMYKGNKIVPLEFLTKLLPDPSTLAKRTKGKTNIGCVIEGIKNGINKKIYIYNVCDHQSAYKETCSQCVSYTTGVPAMIGAKLIMDGIWSNRGVFNVEEFDSKPFMDMLNLQGLAWKILEL